MDGSTGKEIYEEIVVTSNPDSAVGTTKAAGNIDVDKVVKNGKNKLPLFCSRCPSKILNANVGSYVKREQKLPKMTQKKNFVEVECDMIEDVFQLKDIFQFENVGFCHPVDQVKYLSCSECELGPIGWQEIPTSAIFIAISRIRFSSEQ